MRVGFPGEVDRVWGYEDVWSPQCLGIRAMHEVSPGEDIRREDGRPEVRTVGALTFGAGTRRWVHKSDQDAEPERWEGVSQYQMLQRGHFR